MVEEENLKDLMLVESDLGDGGELDLDEEYPPPPPPTDEGTNDNAKHMEGDDIATPKR
jgi:hypothetical protein